MKQSALLALSALTLTACTQTDRALATEPVSLAAANAPNPNAPVPANTSFNGTYDLCGTKVLLEISGKEKAISGADQLRTKFLSPGYKVTFTNLATGKVVTESASGSFTLTIRPDQGTGELKGTGRTVIFDPETGTVIVRIGKIDDVFDLLTGQTISSRDPKIVDLCPAITG